MNQVIYDKSYFLEIPIQPLSSQQQLNLPIIELLNDKYTQAIATYYVETMPVAPSKTPLANSNLLAASFLNLYVGDVNKFWNYPMMDFITLNVPTVTGRPSQPFSVEFNNERIIWQKSYIFIADTSLISAVQAETFVLNIKYTDPVIPAK